LRLLPELIKDVLDQDSQVKELAHNLYKKRSLLIMGRGYQFATCLEGALKVKELTYMHSEGKARPRSLGLRLVLNGSLLQASWPES
jgi:glucosamine--fructose-6-phosphate aminotransferase (isomerizing)